MISNPFTTAVQKAIVLACIAAVVAALALAVVLWLRLATVQRNLDTCTKQRAELKGRVELQSQEIEDWQLMAEVTQQKADKAAAAARAAGVLARQRGDELQARILSGPSTTCTDALSEVRKGWKP